MFDLTINTMDDSVVYDLVQKFDDIAIFNKSTGEVSINLSNKSKHPHHSPPLICIQPRHRRLIMSRHLARQLLKPLIRLLQHNPQRSHTH